MSIGNLFILSYTHVWRFEFHFPWQPLCCYQYRDSNIRWLLFLIFLSWLQLFHGFDRTFDLHSLVKVMKYWLSFSLLLKKKKGELSSKTIFFIFMILNVKWNICCLNLNIRNPRVNIRKVKFKPHCFLGKSLAELGLPTVILAIFEEKCKLLPGSS